MRVELKVTYAGSEPGLSEHRLSLGSFGEPLSLLLKALQRKASAILSQALDDPEYGGRGGKLATGAKLIDLELERIEDGSAIPVLVCSTRMPHSGGQIPMPLLALDLTQDALVKLLDDIDAERSGKLRNASVRKYLSSLPAGLTSQRYLATRDGITIKEVAFETAALPSEPTQLPRIRKLLGNITGVGFEPGMSFITLKSNKSSALRCLATPEQVESAITLRGNQVMAAILEGEQLNLIWIRGADQRVQPPSVEETARYAYAEWGQTLEALAK